MPVDSELISSVKKALEEAQPLLDIELMKKELLEWLAQIKLPSGSSQSSWEKLIKTFPAKPKEELELTGTRLRISLSLLTPQNRYLLTVLENLTPSARGVFTVALFVNPKEEQRQMQKLVEEAYTGNFDDLPRASNILWAQTIRYGELGTALDSGATAILGRELVAKQPPKESPGTPIKTPLATDPDFPEPKPRSGSAKTVPE